MRRREFITLIGGATAVASRPLPAFAQTSSKRPLIAAQLGGSKTGTDRFFGGFFQGMRELGYVEGQDYGFEVGYADGNVSRIPPQIEELVRLKPDIIVSGTTAGVIAAKKLSNTVPIVCADLTNPIEFGLAASYARPGGNVTGVLVTVEDLPTKLLALAVEVIPGAKKIGLLVHSDNPIQPALQRSLDASVNALGVELTVLENRLRPRSARRVPTSGARARQGGSDAIGFLVPQRTEANRVVRHGRAAADGVCVSRECRRRWVDELRGGPA
jgi:putative ABC transport system substrate-binding protein